MNYATKKILSLALVFSTWASVGEKSYAISAGAVGGAAAAAAASSADRKKARLEKEAKFLTLLADPATPSERLDNLLEDVRFLNFDKRDLLYINQARQEVLGDYTKVATMPQLADIMKAAHRINLEKLTQNILHAIADPNVKGDDLGKMIDGYETEIRTVPGRNLKYFIDSKVLESARKEVLGTERKASPEEVLAIIDCMQKKTEQKGYLAGGLMLTLLGAAGYMAYKNNRPAATKP